MSDAQDAMDRAKKVAEYFYDFAANSHRSTGWWNDVLGPIFEDELARTGTGNPNKPSFDTFAKKVTGKNLSGPSAMNMDELRLMADLWREARVARRAQENKPCW